MKIAQTDKDFLDVFIFTFFSWKHVSGISGDWNVNNVPHRTRKRVFIPNYDEVSFIFLMHIFKIEGFVHGH